MRSRESGILRVAFAAGLATAVVLAEGTLAQTSRPDSPPPAATSRPATTAPATTTARGFLAGPLVEPEAMLETPGRNGRNNRDRRAQAVSARRWLALVRETDLSAKQRSEIATVMRELDEARRTYQRRHGKELQRLRRKIGPGNNRATDRRVDPEMRRKLQQLQAMAPKVPKYQQRIWNELTPRQQEELRTKLAVERAKPNRPRRDRQP